MRVINIILATIGWVVVIPVAALLWLAWPEAETSEASSGPTEAQIERSAARTVCKQAITALLHDPDAAEWEPTHRWVAAENVDDPNEFLVQTDMRARNAMGGLIRTTFQCRFTGRGEDMRLMEVTEH